MMCIADDLIVSMQFEKMGKKTVVCLCRLINGFEVVTSASCIREKDFDFNVGSKLARERAAVKIAELEAYAEHNDEYQIG
jgi:hypothetical protein